MNPRKIIARALDAARQCGAADAEVALTRDVNLEIEVAKGEVETLGLAEAGGVGLRLFTQDGRMGFAYSTAGEAGVERVVEAAWHNALATTPDEHNVLPEDAPASDEDWSEQDFAEVPVGQKVDFCRELEQKTLDGDPRITHVQQASYSDTRGEYFVGNSRGLLRSFGNAYGTCSVVAAAGQEGVDSEMGWEFDFAKSFEALRLEWVAGRCVERTVRQLGGTPCRTRAMPVVLDNYVTTQFLGVVAPALMANQVLKGKSLFAEQVGQNIAAQCVTLVDQNDVPGGLNRAPFDAEGASAQRTALVEAGTLRGFMHNAYTAHRMAVETTANAGRGGGFRSVPEVTATNLFLEPGQRSQEELLGAAGEGLFVTSAMGVHMADPISGDFSLGVSGLEIEGGRLGGPVRGVTIAGNLKALLRNIEEVGSDLRFFSSTGAPSVRISEMMVSGE